MKPLAAALCLLLALPAHAEEVKATAVQRARLVLPDGTEAEVGAGCWLSEATCIGAAQHVARLEAEERDVPWVVVGLSFALGVAAGVWVATR